MTRQRSPIRCHGQKHRSQPVHTGLRARLEIVGHDKKNFRLLPDPRAEPRHGCFGLAQLLPGWYEMRPIEPRPPVVLRVGEFHILRADALDERQYLSQMIDVQSMQQEVDHYSKFMLAYEHRHLGLQLEGARTPQKIVQ